MRSIRVAVFGAGSIGSVLGAILSKKNEVLLITRGEHLRAIKERGLRLQGYTEGIFRLDAESYYPGEFDLIILTVKAHQTEEARRTIKKEYNGEPVITFQNGVGIISLLGEFDVIPGVTTHGATLLSPGVVRHAGIGDTYIGEINGEITERVLRIAKNFTACGMKTEVVNDIMERRWIKAALNAVINPITAIFNVSNGILVENEDISEMARCVSDEISEILSIRGIHVDLYSLVMDVAKKTRENKSSMLQDVLNGRRTEVDYIVKPFTEGKCATLLYHMVKFLEHRKKRT